MEGNERQGMAIQRRGLTLIELVIILGIIAVLIGLMLPEVQRSREPARRSKCQNNLEQIGLALHNYEQAFGVLPPAYTVDAEGKRLQSWRVLILPYLDRATLYKLIDLTKPWDDPTNAALAKQIPPVYRCPSTPGPPHHTTYLGVVGEKGYFAGSRPRKPTEITDKHEETLTIVEVREDQGVHWMDPRDADEKILLDFDAKSKWSHPAGRQGAFVDGSVKALGSETPAAEIRRMMTIAGGD